MGDLELLSSNKVFGGELVKYRFLSQALGNTSSQFNVFIPGSANHAAKAPILIYLAGLTCTEDHGPQKGGFFQEASKEGIALVFPDTSPRGSGIDGEDDDWDFGTGAGFYIDATSAKYSEHYNMFTHIRSEIPQVLQKQNFPLDFSRQSVFGHSMGGHGALTLYLKALDSPHTNPYFSVSAFAPITNPTNAPWGHKAFKGYLKGGIEEGKAHDATELISKTRGKVDILIDYGDADKFYKEHQLLPENFVDAARKAGHGSKEVQVRCQPGYDHSYYFISTFAPEHVKFHAKILNGTK